MTFNSQGIEKSFKELIADFLIQHLNQNQELQKL